MNLSTLLDTHQQKMVVLEEVMLANLKTDVPLITTMKHQNYFTGGKKLRALIVLLCCQHYKIPTHIANRVAVGIEFIHTASLLHDDVVDQAKIRRHLPTAAHVFGSTAAILAGDFLYSRASQIFADIGNIALLKNIAYATNKLTEGELLQLMQQKNKTITQDNYFKIIEYKTGNLFQTAASAAAALASQPPTPTATYGKKIGLAFQIIDDCLDYQGSSNKTGKKIGIDFKEKKMTLPIIIMLEQLDSKSKSATLKQWAKGDLSAFQFILDKIAQTDAIKTAHQITAEITQQAIDALHPLPHSPEKDTLIQIATLSQVRDY